MTMHLWPASQHNPDKPARHTQRFLDALFVSAKYVALGVLFLMFLLLGQEMVHHRFSEGGWVNRHGTVRP